MKIRPEKNSGQYRIWTHDLYNTSSDFSSGLIFTTIYCFHFRFCNGSSHIWFLYIYSHWEYNLLFKKILICIPSFELFNFLVWISTTFKLYNCSDEKGYLKFIFIFRTLLKLGSLLWSRNIPLLVCRSYGFIGCMRIVLQEHCGKNHNIFFCGIMLHLYLWD